MVRMFVRHRVADYDRWRHVYDDFAPLQKRLGVRAEAVYQATDDANDITVTHDFDDEDAAQAFSDSDELRTAMADAGVASEPQIWLTTQRE
jgi:hypothetical protein